MRFFPVLAPLVVVAVSACQPGTPTCMSPAARELRTIDRLIDDTRATLARGYTVEKRSGATVNFCLGSGSDNVGVSFCTDGGTQKVPIDPVVEQRKLDGLLARKAQLERQAAADRAACVGANG